MSDAAAPWGDPGRLGRKLFSFAVIADTHVNQEEGKASSDFAVNRLANARSRFALREIDLAAPEFVLHLGDIVHPTPIHPGYAAAAASFRELAKALRCPIHLTPGNHDVGDKAGEWLPVPTVNDAYLAMYREQFGEHYYAFDSNGCHFVVIDAQILNTGLACEAEQRAWLEADLERHSGGRIFLCTHYPPYLFDADEESHYDNLDEPGRSWLLALLARHRVEAVFAGHVHNFWYHRRGETEIYLLPSPAFVRLDYAELFRVEPAPERGRNDAPKLGWFLVDVHERGHVAHPRRTLGEELAPDARPAPAARRLPPVHTKTVANPSIGIDLRYPWAECVEVAPSGAVDEFVRKTARNDYPLMTLWESGVRRLRVPLADLVNAATRERMRDLRRVGHAFTVHTFGLPAGRRLEALREHLPLLDGWEVVAALPDVAAMAAAIREIRGTAPVAVCLSRLQRHGSGHHHGDRARHVIQHGFSLEEGEEIRALLADEAVSLAFDAMSFRVDCDRAPWEDIHAIGALAREFGRAGHAYVRLASNVPSVARDDDLANANRVVEAMLAARAQPAVAVTLDTFADVDRGYFPRTGLVDRRYNPRLAGNACRHLQSVFESEPAAFVSGRARARPGARLLCLEGPASDWVAVLPAREVVIDTLPLAGTHPAGSGNARAFDLARGAIREVPWTRGESPDGPVARLAAPLVIGAPAVVNFSG